MGKIIQYFIALMQSLKVFQWWFFYYSLGSKSLPSIMIMMTTLHENR